jgi:hypothetical protein
MRRSRRSADLTSESAFVIKKRKRVPFEFVLDALASVSPWTGPMFGCLAMYVDEKIVLILRDKPGPGKNITRACDESFPACVRSRCLARK